MSSRNVNEQLDALGYTDNWLRFGVLSPALLDEQIDALRSGFDSNTEHFRYQAFRVYLRSKQSLSDTEFANYLHLALEDPDPVMATAALADLFDNCDLSDAQFETLCSQLDQPGSGVLKMVRRQRLLRTMKAEPLTDELFAAGLASDDSVVHEYLLSVADAKQLQALAEHGANKKIRRQAERRLERHVNEPG